MKDGALGMTLSLAHNNNYGIHKLHTHLLSDDDDDDDDDGEASC